MGEQPSNIEPSLRLSKVVVRDLFGLYDHTISVNLSERVTIVHGPNGIGKTVLLGLVSAVFDGRYLELVKFPFKALELAFVEGALLTISNPGYAEQDSPVGGDASTSRLSFTLTGASPATQQFEFRFDPMVVINNATQANIYLPWLTRRTVDTWHDASTNEIVSAFDVLIRYSEQIPEALRRQNSTEPEWLKTFRNRLPIHFIETQRLLEFGRGDPRRMPYVQGAQMSYAVKSISHDLIARIGQTLARYANNSQALDQTFPRRLLAGTVVPFSVPELKNKMAEIDARRAELRKVGLLDDTTENPLGSETLDKVGERDRAVITLYVEDNAKKLNALDDLWRRVSLLLRIVKARFLHKELEISRQAGFIVRDDNARKLDLNDLSSGEQHELILSYNLLFSVQENSLVLIDEPELSLHVEWQTAFLNDLLEIVKAIKFDVILATHSPYIIGEHDDLMVALSSDNIAK